MAVWREEDHPRDERGRWIHKGAQSAVPIGRTIERMTSADDADLLDVFVRLVGKRRPTRAEQEAMLRLDAEMARRDAGGAPEPTPEERQVDELLARGWSYTDAYAEAYGRGPAETDQDAARRPGESREQSRRREYKEMVYLSVLRAESWTRGHLLSPEGKARGIDPASLFGGPRARARRYASEELQRYWAEVEARQTYAEWRADRVGTAAERRRAESSRLAGSGRDHGL